MEQTGSQPGLELRLTVLARRIRELKERMRHPASVNRLEELGEIDELEGRHAALERRLHGLHQEGVGVLPAAKAEIEMLADDLAGTLRDFIKRIDADFRPDPVGPDQVGKEPGKP